jgi:hypothetical protein
MGKEADFIVKNGFVVSGEQMVEADIVIGEGCPWSG